MGQGLVDSHVFQEVESLREDTHLVPVSGEVRRKKDIPQTAHMREEALGPESITLQCSFHKLCTW